MCIKSIAASLKTALFCLSLTITQISLADYYSVSNDVDNLIGSVVRCDDSGNVIGTFGEDVLIYPISMAWDRQGILYVADYATGEVQRFQADGKHLGVFAQVDDLISSIAFHPDGSLLVARYEGDKIWRFTGDGTPMGEFVSGNGLQRHGQMAFDSLGNLYVCSWTEYVILKYDSDGNPLGVWSDNSISGILGVTGMAFDPFGQMYVSEYSTNALKLLDANGFLVSELTTTFAEPEYLTLEPDGTLLVPFFYEDTIHRFSSDGTDLGEFTQALGSYQIQKGPHFVMPHAYTRLRGRVDAGNENSLTVVDNDPLRVCRFFVVNASEPPIQVNVHGVSPVASPSALTVHMTSRMATSGLFAQELIMIDNNGTLSPARRTDNLNQSSKTIELFADVPANFVGADGSINVRYNVRAIGPVATQLWCHEADQVAWTVVE